MPYLLGAPFIARAAGGGGGCDCADWPGFDPVSLGLTGYWRPNGSTQWGGTSPWPATASTGTSGANDLNAPAPHRDPDVGAAVNGYAPSNWDGLERTDLSPFTGDPRTTQTLRADGTLDDYLNASAFSGWALVNPSDTGSMYIWNSNSASPDCFSVFLSGGQIGLQLNDGLTYPSGSKILCGRGVTGSVVTPGVWGLVTFRCDGVNVQLGFNEIPGAAAVADPQCVVPLGVPLSDLTNTLNMGIWDADFFKLHTFYGDIAEAGLIDRAMTDAEFCALICYARARYALPLVAP